MTHEYENEKDVVVADDGVNERMDQEILREAATADAAEHKMTVADGWRTHKKAIMWSMLLSGALIMEGYDVVVIGSFYGHPAFLKRFGVYSPGSNEVGYIIPAEWQSALSNGSSAGGIIGLLVSRLV
jgi:SP family general alpha glucoside:H+ symporter-like MFS transporter